MADNPYYTKLWPVPGFYRVTDLADHFNRPVARIRYVLASRGIECSQRIRGRRVWAEHQLPQIEQALRGASLRPKRRGIPGHLRDDRIATTKGN